MFHPESVCSDEFYKKGIGKNCLPGRRTRRHSDSLLYCKLSEVEVASMKQMEQVEEWRKEKQILELKMAELKEALNTEGKSNLNRK